MATPPRNPTNQITLFDYCVLSPCRSRELDNFIGGGRGGRRFQLRGGIIMLTGARSISMGWCGVGRTTTGTSDGDDAFLSDAEVATDESKN